MKSQMPTTLEFALLGLLHQTPQSGYDLRKVFAETAMGNYSSSPGAIYPALKRLEDKTYIAGVIDASTSLRPKKVFSTTTKGRKTFREWLLQEMSVDDVRRRPDELMLRFAFYSTIKSPDATKLFLNNLVEKSEEYLNELLKQRAVLIKIDKGVQKEALHGRMAFEFGIEQQRALERWARKALKNFQTE